MSRTSRVTNADLAAQLKELSGLVTILGNRISVIETESKVAKWVLRSIGLAFIGIIADIISHFKRS
jgi:hypothetical protein